MLADGEQEGYKLILTFQQQQQEEKKRKERIAEVRTMKNNIEN